MPPATGSDAQRALDLAAAVGIELFPWQIAFVEDALAVRPDGKWAAKELGLIVPRQNGKGKILEVLELYWLFLSEGDRLVTHTAHRADTSKEHMLRMSSLIEDNPMLSKRLKLNGIRVANGDESIHLKDGTRLLFKTRSKGSGRGFDGQKIVFDEAYYLFDVAAQLPTLSAQVNPQVLFTSSSPVAGSESDVLRQICRDGRAGETDGMAFTEYSCPPGSDLDDEDNWWDANPSMGYLLTPEWTTVERRRMTDQQFGEERLGIWLEDEAAAGVVDMARWNSQAITSADESWLADPVCFGVEGNAAGDCFTVVAAGHAGDKLGFDVVRHEHGTDWLLEWAIGVNERQKPKGWVFDPKSSTADLFMAAFRDAGLNVIECGFADRALPRATAGMYDDMHNGRTEHLAHPALDAAVAGATWRYVGESRLWDRKAGVALAPLVAATLARHGLLEVPAAAPAPFLIRR